LGRPDENPSLQKLYYRIGEVAQIVGVETHVLRYWESEFPSIRPQKSRSGQRVYSRKDVTKLLRVKELLYTERFTIEGARQRLRSREEESTPTVQPSVRAASSRKVREILISARKEVLQALVQFDEPRLDEVSSAKARLPIEQAEHPSPLRTHERVADQDTEVRTQAGRRDGDHLSVRR
jgi:DNA-binding transcriptional MerR regulator